MSIDPTEPETIDWRDKSLWTVDRPRPVAEFAAEWHGLFDGTVSWPALVLREPVLRANIETMAAYTARHRMLFAPHGKTSMAPELFRMQLEAGAWGITVATPHQAMVALRAGVPRVLIAHEVLDGVALRKLLAVRDEAAAELYCFVDSPEGARAAGEAAVAAGSTPLRMLLDVGFPGGRTGVRTVAQALEVAETVARTLGAVLVGTACYEGGLQTVEEVAGFFGTLREITEALVAAGLLGAGAEGGGMLVSAGGSAFFDLVVSELAGEWAERMGASIVLRSGAYVTHDDGMYAERTPFTRVADEGGLGAALELWAQVVSVPEPGLVLAGMGKRDAPIDEGLPVPKLLRRTGSDLAVPLVAECFRLNDQHAFVRLPEGLEVRPGDLVCFGISHPCTAFDKWRSLPLVDARDRIVDVFRTYF